MVNFRAMKKIIYSIFAMITLFVTKLTFALDLDIQWGLKGVTETFDPKVAETSLWEWKLPMLSGFLNWFKTELLSIVEVVVIWVLIWIGFKVVMARWNPEEFKKAWIWLIYVILWVFFIFAAWWIVRLVSTLSL